MLLTLPVDPGLRTLTLDPFENLPVGLHNATQVLAEPVLVENPVAAIGHRPIPEAAGVRADLIGQQQGTIARETEFDLEVDELQTATVEQLAQLRVDAQGELLHRAELLRIEQTEQLQAGLRQQRVAEGELVVADEISPDTCRLWDRAVADAGDRILDKDRFRQDLGGVIEAYGEVLKRVQGVCPEPHSYR